jgi:hypothetical protein
VLVGYCQHLNAVLCMAPLFLSERVARRRCRRQGSLHHMANLFDPVGNIPGAVAGSSRCRPMKEPPPPPTSDR